MNMNKVEQRCIIKFLWKEGTDAHEIQQRLKAVYRDWNYAISAICESMRTLKLGRTEIHEFHRSERLPLDHIDDDMMFLPNSVSFSTVRTPDETLRLRASTILHHLRKSFGVKPYHFRSVPHELTYSLKEKRVIMCRQLLKLLQMEETFGLARVLTGDESWLYLNYSHTDMWSVSDDERLIRVGQTIASERHRLSVIWSRKCPLKVEWLGLDDKFDTTYFCDLIIAKLIEALYPGERF
jgi:hypothetical protein